MEEAESAMPTLAALKAIGVQLAVDDFGVAYSRFSYLRKFPLDALKATRSFINDISSNPDKTMILSALISIGKEPQASRGGRGPGDRGAIALSLNKKAAVRGKDNFSAAP